MRRDVDDHLRAGEAGIERGLCGRPERHRKVHVHIGLGLDPEGLGHALLDLGDAGRAAHEQHALDVRHRDPGLLQGLAGLGEGRFEVVLDEGVERPAGERGDEIEVPTADLEVVVDRGLDLGGEADLGLLGQVPETRHGERIRRRIDPVPIADPIDQVQDDAVVEVVAPEEGVSARGQDLLAGPRDRQDRAVEGAAAEVIDEPALLGRVPAPSAR